VGKLAVMATFDTAGTLLRKMDYTYQTKETFNLKGVKLYYEPAFSTPASLGNYYIKYFDCVSTWNVLSSEEERIYSPGKDIMATVKNFYYDNPSHQQITRETVVKSDGSTVVKKYRYPGDYPAAGGDSFVTEMKQRNIISPLIEEQTLLKKGSTTSLLSGSFTEYRLFHGKFYKPGLVFKLENSKPLPDTMESGILPGNQLALHPAYQPDVYFDHYNPLGNIVKYHRAHDETYQTYLWGYQQSWPVAEVKNAGETEVFYSSFEEEGTPADMAIPAQTGNKYLNSGAWSIPFIPAGDGKAYLMSYWYFQDDRWRFSGEMPFQNSINSGTRLDEIRVYPEGAQMTTFTYDSLVGVRSVTDINNMTTYYDYDPLSRLKVVKDHNGHILKKYDYRYAGE
jgi:hypothetical protein